MTNNRFFTVDAIPHYYLGNGFSLQMLDDLNAIVRIIEIDPKTIPSCQSCIGHVDTAAVVGSILGTTVPMNRVNIKLHRGDVLYVAQLVGGRLPEGATTLPENFDIKFLQVEVMQ